MENLESLTATQKGLVQDLIKEFKKINPKPQKSGGRFSFESISNCLNEETRFFETIKKANLSMGRILIEKLLSEIKEFEEEFGELIEIKLGYIPYNNIEISRGLEEFKRELENKPIGPITTSSYVKLFFVSKVKEFKGDGLHNYFEGKAYFSTEVFFRVSKISVVLESGASISANKIVGLGYEVMSHLSRAEASHSLDEYIQTHKRVQQDIVNLCK